MVATLQILLLYSRKGVHAHPAESCKADLPDTEFHLMDGHDGDIVHDTTLIGGILKKMDANLNGHNLPVVLGIAGGSGSGKSTLATAILMALGKEHVTYISHDSYYKDLRHLTLVS